MAAYRYDATVTSLYAELLDQLLALEGQRSITSLRGGFATKKLNQRLYWYFQYREPNQSVRQIYIGPDNEATRRFAERFEEDREKANTDEQQIEKLSAMLRQGGIRTADAGTFRILRALADSGLFRQGAVLVGTHAFVTLGNLLGVRWDNPSAQTQDIDVAQDNSLDLALPPSQNLDLPTVLDNLKIGFLPVPALNAKEPSTSFKIRGRDLRLDLLTPATSQSTKPVFFDSINACAKPLKFLDYIMEQPERAAFIGRSAFLVNVPDPARFAFHKLISSQVRTAAFHAKARKDLMQAAQLLEVLFEERRFDIESAWQSIQGRGKRWVQVIHNSLDKLEHSHPGLATAVKSLLSS